jgi:hypothetical protein
MLDQMQQLGLVTAGSCEGLLEAGVDRLFMPHGLGHFLGLDVHDVSDVGPVPQQLQEGQVITVEPGEVSESRGSWKGSGFRRLWWGETVLCRLYGVLRWPEATEGWRLFCCQVNRPYALCVICLLLWFACCLLCDTRCLLHAYTAS